MWLLYLLLSIFFTSLVSIVVFQNAIYDYKLYFLFGTLPSSALIILTAILGLLIGIFIFLFYLSIIKKFKNKKIEEDDYEEENAEEEYDIYD